MAIDNLSNIISNIPSMFASEGERLWVRDAPLVSRIKKVGNRPNVNWTVSNGGATVNTVGEGDDIQASEYNQDDRVALTLNRAIKRTAFGLTHTELATVAQLRPDMAADTVRDLLRERFFEAQSKIARGLEIVCLTGTGTATSPLSASVHDVVGLLNAIKTSGSYAGQSLSGNAGLVGNVAAAPSGNVSRAAIDSLFASIMSKSGRIPDFGMCSPATAAVVKQISDNQIRFNAPDLSRELNNSQRAPDSMGPAVMSYNGIPIFVNSAWYEAGADGYLVFGSFDALELDYLPYKDWGDAAAERQLQAISSNGRDAVPVGLPLMCYAPAKTGSSVKFSLEVEVALKVKAPNRFGIITGITGATTN